MMIYITSYINTYNNVIFCFQGSILFIYMLFFLIHHSYDIIIFALCNGYLVFVVYSTFNVTTFLFDIGGGVLANQLHSEAYYQKLHSEAGTN